MGAHKREYYDTMAVSALSFNATLCPLSLCTLLLWLGSALTLPHYKDSVILLSCNLINRIYPPHNRTLRLSYTCIRTRYLALYYEQLLICPTLRRTFCIYQNIRWLMNFIFEKGLVATSTVSSFLLFDAFYIIAFVSKYSLKVRFVERSLLRTIHQTYAQAITTTINCCT